MSKTAFARAAFISQTGAHIMAAAVVASSRIQKTFSRTQAEGRAAFVAYLCAGDPDLETSLAACRTVIENGVDVLELGVPFSDPLADGVTNQLAAQRALRAGIGRKQVFELVRRIRAEFSELPIVLYTYYNLVFANGIDDYVREARAAGVDGLLTLDLPPEEAGELSAACEEQGLQTVFIVAPTTPAERVTRIVECTTGFIYYVSREGVTGTRDSLVAGLGEAVAKIKARTTLPVVVGFGISKREHVQVVGTVADGVVVGSLLVGTIADNIGSTERVCAALAEQMRELSPGLVRS